MVQNLVDFYSIIISLERLLETQIKLLDRCRDTDSMDISNCQQVQRECKVYESTYQSILSRQQKVLEFPLQVLRHQLSSHKTLCQQLTESAFQEFQTALTREVGYNRGFLKDLNAVVKNLPIEDLDQKSDEGDELVQDEWDEWDRLDELDENKWNGMSELGDLDSSCESDEPGDFNESGKSGELGEVSGIQVEKLVETLALGRYLVN